MAIVDNTEPKQAVSCDLCGVRFDRPVKSDYDFIFEMWKDVSISIYPNLGKSDDSFSGKGYIRIEHACEYCREKFLAESRSLIEKLKTIA